MANIKSAIKRIDLTEKNTKRNRTIKNNLKNSIRKFEDAIESGNAEEAEELLKVVDKNLKKATTKNVLHKNNAAHKLSRLSKKLNKLG